MDARDRAFLREGAGQAAALLRAVGNENRLLVLCLLFLRHLLRLLKSAARERPFTHANAQRLQRMAWLMLAMELLSILIGAYAAWMGPDFTWMEVGGGMSITGLVAVLMLFVLARVFAVGAAMRDDLDGVI